MRGRGLARRWERRPLTPAGVSVTVEATWRPAACSTPSAASADDLARSPALRASFRPCWARTVMEGGWGPCGRARTVHLSPAARPPVGAHGPTSAVRTFATV